MKKKVFRALRSLSEKVLGEEKTNEIIQDTIKKYKEETLDKEINTLLEETKPKRKRVFKKVDK